MCCCCLSTAPEAASAAPAAARAAGEIPGSHTYAPREQVFPDPAFFCRRPVPAPPSGTWQEQAVMSARVRAKPGGTESRRPGSPGKASANSGIQAAAAIVLLRTLYSISGTFTGYEGTCCCAFARIKNLFQYAQPTAPAVPGSVHTAQTGMAFLCRIHIVMPHTSCFL